MANITVVITEVETHRGVQKSVNSTRDDGLEFGFILSHGNASCEWFLLEYNITYEELESKELDVPFAVTLSESAA